MSRPLLRDEIAAWMRRQYFGATFGEILHAFRDRRGNGATRAIAQLLADGVIERVPPRQTGDREPRYRYVAKAKRGKVVGATPPSPRGERLSP